MVKTGKTYKVYTLHDTQEKLIFASSDISQAIEAARAYLDYKPSPQEISDLKNFFKNKPTQSYTFSANFKVVKMVLERN